MRRSNSDESIRRIAPASVLLGCAALLAALPLSAVKPPEPSALEKGPRLEVAAVAVELASLDTKLVSGTAEARARQALAVHAQQLGLRSSDGHDLEVRAIREGLSGTTVRLRQHIDGVPVYGAEIAVTFNHQGIARTISSTYRPLAQLDTVAPQLARSSADTIARQYLGADGDGQTLGLDTDLVVYEHAGVSTLAHRIKTLGPGSTGGGWELLVDAASGEVLRAEDTLHYVDGTGNVFLPDPLASAGAQYGDPGFTDGGDADTPQMTAEVFPVSLLDITDNAGTFFLTGPWAEVIDHDSPFKGLFEQATNSWNFTRQADAFEAANTYYHIDTYMRYLNDTLGVSVEPYQYATGVRFDPSGWGGADNSSYSTGTGRLSFGEGCVDDAEDADVIIHELGHGLHDWVTSGGLSQNQGLSEGVGDYAAQSYSRSFNDWQPSDPEYNWVFSWDGHNACWSGRRTDWNDGRLYPDDLTGSIHTDGQFWSSCNIDILEAIGRDKSETAHWEGLARTSGGTNQQAAAQAVLDAAGDLGYSSTDLLTMEAIYQGCGYVVTAPVADVVFIDGFESGDMTSWSASTP